MKLTSPSTARLHWRWLKKPAVLLTAALGILGITGSAGAAVVLPSLPAGSQYRIVFITSGTYKSYNATTPAETRDIAYYNSLLEAEANASSSTVMQGATFRLVGSHYNGSATTLAPDVAGMGLADSIPVYNTKGELVASDSTVFWSQAHTAAMNGDREGATINANAWNGWTDTLAGFRPFGSAGQTFYTNSGSTSPWAAGNVLGATNFLRVFGISEPLTIASIPEPSTAMLGGLAIVGLLRRRRR